MDLVVSPTGQGSHVTRLSHSEGGVNLGGCWSACVVPVQGALGTEGPTRAIRATAAAERLRRALADLSVCFTRALQPTAEALGQGLRLSNEAVQLFSEEVKPLVSFPGSVLPSLYSQELRVTVVPASPGLLQQALSESCEFCIHLVLRPCVGFQTHLSGCTSDTEREMWHELVMALQVSRRVLGGCR